MDVFFLFTLVIFLIVHIGWLGLCHALFRALRSRHPRKFIEMGRPFSVFTSVIDSNHEFLRFLYRGEWNNMNDPSLSTLGESVRVYSIVYVILLIAAGPVAFIM